MLAPAPALAACSSRLPVPKEMHTQRSAELSLPCSELPVLKGETFAKRHRRRAPEQSLAEGSQPFGSRALLLPPRAEVLLSYSAVRCSTGSVGTRTFCSTVVATEKGGIDARQPWWVKENHHFKPLSSLEQFLSMA